MKQVLASEVAFIPIWKGNRPFSMERAESIIKSIHALKDLSRDPFFVAVLKNKQYIVDGQHRAAILKNYFSKPESNDFYVNVVEDVFLTEDEVEKFSQMSNRNVVYD